MSDGSYPSNEPSHRTPYRFLDQESYLTLEALRRALVLDQDATVTNPTALRLIERVEEMNRRVMQVGQRLQEWGRKVTAEGAGYTGGV